MSLAPGSSLIFGLSGPALTPDERSFFREAQPLGFILFAWNCLNPVQIYRLTQDLREVMGRAHLPILIDEEGGCVSRLPSAFFPHYPPPASWEVSYRDASDWTLSLCRQNYRHLGETLLRLGITVDCFPCLDLKVEGAHDVIGSRAFSHDPQIVGALGRSALEGMEDSGVVPIVKHLPGHGAANQDSHVTLPRIPLARDQLQPHFDAFSAARPRDWGMLAHVIYEALDPEHPASLSYEVIQKTVREKIGFDGFLITDDVYMDALATETPASKVECALRAGCDAVLYARGDLKEFEQAMMGARPLTSLSQKRLLASGFTIDS